MSYAKVKKTVLLFCVFICGFGQLQAAEVKRSISEIAPGLFKFQNNFHNAVFLVTDEGILLTDPINKEAALWLKQELKKRFEQPIKYLVYSHDHADHISGGEVFADEAVVIAHQNARADIIAEKRATAVPDITFEKQLKIELGGQQVELYYLGRSHSDNMIVMLFPEQKVLFAVDFVSIKRLPYRDLGDAYFPEWIDAVKRVEHMRFETLLPGHGPAGNKADVKEHRSYLQALYSQVLDAARAGQSLEEIKKTVTLDQFSHLGQFQQWRELNIEGVYRQVQLHRRGN